MIEKGATCRVKSSFQWVIKEQWFQSFINVIQLSASPSKINRVLFSQLWLVSSHSRILPRLRRQNHQCSVVKRWWEFVFRTFPRTWENPREGFRMSQRHRHWSGTPSRHRWLSCRPTSGIEFWCYKTEEFWYNFSTFPREIIAFISFKIVRLYERIR